MIINFKFKTMDFPLFCVKHSSISLLCTHDFINLSQNPVTLSIHILFGFAIILIEDFLKTSVIVIAFLSFKEITHAFLLKISMTHN